MSGFVQTWAGECSAWDCDGLGHMNMRHYMTKVHQARRMLIILLGLENAFLTRTHTTVRVCDFHIKYLGEARPDDPLRIESAVIDLRESDLTACHVIYHVDGRLAATIIERVEHVYIPTQSAFAWPRRVRDKASEFSAVQPGPSKPRGFDYELTSKKPNESQLQSWGMTRIGMGVYRQDEMGLDERITPEALLGRVTETIGHFRNAWQEMYEDNYRESGGSAALLEARIFINSPVSAGQPYYFYSGIQGVNSHTRTLVHHMINPLTGQNLFSMMGIGCLFNVKTRKLIKATPEQIANLEAHANSDIDI